MAEQSNDARLVAVVGLIGFGRRSLSCCAIENRQRFVAGCLHDAPLVGGDCRIDDLTPESLQGRERADLISTHQA
jgi:hypothetical protein